LPEPWLWLRRMQRD